jgi:hypothetical protein
MFTLKKKKKEKKIINFNLYKEKKITKLTLIDKLKLEEYEKKITNYHG